MTAQDWYSKKLGIPPASQQPEYVPQYQQQTQPPPPAEEEYRPRGARHLIQSTTEGNCPACDSPNYMRATRTTALRCYDCGYPLEQTGSGGGSGTGGEGPVGKARQVNPQGTWVGPAGFQKGSGVIGKDPSVRYSESDPHG